ncbi:MAG: family 16 glycosylhydrolase [Bacteroidetes bacterium]|nr:family 16 glycosylhydrolase [Bacteroidota bacterium]
MFSKLVFAQTLVWSDEFDYTGPIDSEKWHHQTLLPNGGSWYNGEIQHYTNRIENSFVSDGTLKIMAIRENYTQQGVTKEFTSARLNSKFAFTYGRVEVRAKLPFGVGTWPAIWTLGQNITEPGGYFYSNYGTTPWPACGEIDIMEHWGINQNYISSATHTPSSYGGTVNVGGRYVDNVSSEFHIYRLEWSETRLIFSVDNQVHYIYEPSVQNMETWPFDLNQYILLNVAVLPDIVDTDFTQDAMEIDYVSVYQNNLSTDDRESDSFRIYPNPSSDFIQIKGDVQNRLTYRLSNNLGQVLKQGVVGVQSNSIDITSLPAGLYFLELADGKAHQITRILKN